MDWTYGGLYKKYPMDKELHIGCGIVKVHDIFKPLPEYMKDADFILTDPPYNKSALSSFYTKAGIDKKPESFDEFILRFFEVVDEINPKYICIEAGLPQTDMFVSILKERYKNIFVVESYYYGNKKNKCNMIFASNLEIPDCVYKMPFFDEEKAIEYLCNTIDCSCVCDPFMGLGLVAFYANRAGKKFVGTELNKYRLAVCAERVITGERGNIK